MVIKNLVETAWLARYTWTAEITYDQGSEFIADEKNVIKKNVVLN